MLDREIQKDDLCEDTNGDGIVDIPKACAAQVGFSYVVPEGKVSRLPILTSETILHSLGFGQVKMV